MKVRVTLASLVVVAATAMAPSAVAVTAADPYTPPPSGVKTSTDGGILHEADGAALTVDPEASTAGVSSKTGTSVDPNCKTVMVKAGAPNSDVTKYCTVTTEVGSDPPTTATAADRKMIAAQEGTTVAAVSRFSVSCQDWYSYQHVLPDWSEHQIGRACSGNRQVWVWSYPGADPFPITSGYHYCHKGWSALGWHLHTDHCNIVQVYDSNFYGGYFRQNWDRYTVSFGYGILTLDYSKKMHVNVFPSGAITFHV